MDYGSLDKMPSVAEEPAMPEPEGTMGDPDDQDAEGELTDAEKLHAKTMGFSPKQALALKEFISSCLEADEYSE